MNKYYNAILVLIINLSHKACKKDISLQIQHDQEITDAPVYNIENFQKEICGNSFHIYFSFKLLLFTRIMVLPVYIFSKTRSTQLY